MSIKQEYEKCLQTIDAFAQLNFDFLLEDDEYKTCLVQNNAMRILCKTGKNTPKKDGVFVTSYWRDDNGVIKPYSRVMAPDFMLIYATTVERAGYFLFPKHVLFQQGIFASDTCSGKLAFRIYPPYLQHLNSTAFKKQTWQKKYYVELF